MGQLPDWMILDDLKSGRIGVTPWDPKDVQPASLDVHLGRSFRTENGLEFQINGPHPEVLYPNQFILGHTREFIRLPADVAARVEGKSTIGRQGLMIHVSAGFVDPGFEGELTLELKNLSTTKQFQLHSGMLIAQISFHQLLGPAVRPYGSPDLGSHYQGQTGPTAAYKEGRNGSPS